jgi:hypothetical protein
MPLSRLVKLGLVVFPGLAFAQEAIFTRAATQPAAGVLAWRQQFKTMHYSDDSTEFSTKPMLSYGVTGNLAVDLQLPLITMNGGWREQTGLGDLTILAKGRLWQRHDSAIDTARLGVWGGTTIPVGADVFTGGGFDPIFGAVYMQVAGRNGFNLATQYQLTTRGSWHPMMPGAGTADLIRIDGAYLWRLAPEQYSTEEDAAFYFTIEANTFLETNGDRELLLSPGLLYEGTSCALELGVQLPVARCVTERPAQGFGVTIGFRLLY